MENNLENKAKFFAQYWGQKVFKIQVENCPATQEVNPQFIGKFLDDKSILELKPLSSITDEDKAQIGSIENVLNAEEECYINWGNSWNDLVFFNSLVPGFQRYLLIESYQYLQSKGYALPFMGLSVEKQIEYGWIKLEVPNA